MKKKLKKVLKKIKRKIRNPKRFYNVAKKSGWTYWEAKRNMIESEEKYGIEFKTYAEKQLWKYPMEQQPDVLDGTYKYYSQVCENYPIEYSAVKEKMNYAKDEHGISFEKFISDNMILLNEMRFRNACFRFSKKNAKIEKKLAKQGFTLADADKLIRFISKETGFVVNYETVQKYGLLKKNKTKALEKARSLQEIEKLRKTISRKNGAKKNEEQLEKLCILLEKTMTRKDRKTIYDTLAMNPELKELMETKDLVSDARAMNLVRGTSVMEYMMMHFATQPMEARWSYLTNVEKNRVLRKLPKGKDCALFTDMCDLFDDKYRSYERFKEHYHRDAIVISSDDDYPQFLEFCKNNKEFMKKPLSASQGKGIRIVRLTENDDLRDIFTGVRENRIVILEGLIKQSPEVAKFNEDSINTFRLITFHNGISSHVEWGFFRTGKKGAIVDNAGAGGVYASIDAKTGTIGTDGANEDGEVFLTHPDSGEKYKGFAIPHWEELEKICTELANEFPFAAIIGWDFALNSNNEWVIIEVNSMPEFVHQGPMFAGVRDRFYELVRERKANLGTTD